MSLDAWTEQLRRGALEFAILLTLAPAPRYGLEIIRHFESFADLLITDASSVANEYTLLDRPIVFIDVPELFELTLSKHARLDLEARAKKLLDRVN